MTAVEPRLAGNRPEVPCDTLLGRFARVCEQHGSAIAITFEQRQVSYRELAAGARSYADSLRQLGAGPGTLVAISLERGVDLVAAMLGVMMSGAAYLPLDPAYPAARIVETLEDARPLAIVDSGGVSLLEGALPVDATAAYVIYTSGSTGKPKGVVVSEQNLLRLFDQTEPWFRFSPADVWTLFHSFAFDFSVWELWGPLLTGGRLVIVSFATSRDPEALRELLTCERVTVLNQTPSAFALLNAADAKAESSLSLRVIVFGGEALNLTALSGWLARHGDERPQLFNMYGITETTIHVTCRRIRAADCVEHDSLIGDPIPDLQVRLLDTGLQPVGDGAEGEICIGGAGVAIGYLRRPDLTAERFAHDAAGTRLYRSGDMGRRRADGELVYLGRRDNQVKIAGFRVELSEVEAGLLRCAAVEQACAIVWTGRLVAFVCGKALNEKTLAAELGTALASSMPAYMRPSLYRLAPSLPLTINGKADRSELARRLDAECSAESAGTIAATCSGDPLERIRSIWARVLGVPGIGIDDNFFDVGGNSLLLVRVREALISEFAREIPVLWMFEATTVRTLADRLAGQQEFTTGDEAAERARKARTAFGRARAAKGKAK